MKEDQLTNALIEANKDPNNLYKSVESKPEVHYNYYGDRGVVDLFTRRNEYGVFHDSVYEIKSRPNNANKVIRQFNRMTNFFYKGSDYRRGDWIKFELCFLATKRNYEHVKENKEMYGSLYRNGEDAIVTFRHPSNITPVHAFSGSKEYEIGSEGFKGHAQAVGNFEHLQKVKQ